jgi:hypothetical protein
MFCISDAAGRRIASLQQQKAVQDKLKRSKSEKNFLRLKDLQARNLLK